MRSVCHFHFSNFLSRRLHAIEMPPHNEGGSSKTWDSGTSVARFTKLCPALMGEFGGWGTVLQLLADAVKLSETRLIWGNHGLAGCDLARLLNRYYIGDCSASSSQRDRPTLKAWNEKLFLHHRHNQYRHHNVLSTFFQVQSLVSLLARAPRAFPPTCGHDIGVGNSSCQACKNAHSY